MLAVIGCGNANRCDDGVGVVVAQRLQRAFADRPADLPVKVYDAGTDGMGVMFQARGADALIIVDACQTGAEPGAVYEVPGGELEQPPNASFNLHDFRWDHALFAGRKIYGDGFPSEVTVLLVEAGDLGYGLELTDPVVRAADTVVARVEALVADYLERHVVNADDGTPG